MATVRPHPPGTGATARRRPRLDFSLSGVLYACLLLFIGLAAIHSQANLLFAVFGIMIGVLLASGVLSRLVLRRLELRRLLPEMLTVGQPATIQYEFTNGKRFWPSFSVMLYELTGAAAFTRQPVAFLLHVAAGRRALVSTQVIPQRRGLYRLDRFQLCTSFPFGFVRRAWESGLPETVLVHPPVAAVDRHLLSLCLSAESSGTRMRARRGGTDEFYGVKEYRAGENPRFIHWKRSAHTGTLVAREMAHVAPPRLVIFLDTYLAPEARTEPARAEVERAIALAASLIACTVDEGLAVGLHTFAGEPLTILPSRGKRHARDLLAALARLPANDSFPQRRLLDSAPRLLQPGATGVLIVPGSGATVVPAGQATWLVLASESGEARRWFTFPPGTDFQTIVPLEDAAPPVGTLPPTGPEGV
jgi:uncharacterized protein (DUF58 family)